MSTHRNSTPQPDPFQANPPRLPVPALIGPRRRISTTHHTSTRIDYPKEETVTSVEPYKRDYAADMRKYLDEARNTDGPYNAVTAAAVIADKIQREDPELYYGWLEAHATATIRAALTAADAATRAHARTTTASVFAAAAAAAEAGDPAPLKQGFLQAVYVVDSSYNRKALKDMIASDLTYVAGNYEDRARSQMFEATFFRALARKVGDGRVADVFNNQELSELHDQVTGK
jgi:hypothetical protein